MHRDIEALIFCSPEPVSVAELLSCMRKLHGDAVVEKDVRDTLEELSERYRQSTFSFEVVQLAGGYRFLTKPQHKEAITLHLQEQAKKRLSTSALETLSIIAYKQPVTKAEVEHIRGVNCDYTVLKLLEKNLVAIAGRKDAPGRPVLYQTTERFLEHVGLASLKDLPPLRENPELSEAGDAPEILIDLEAPKEEL